MRFIFISSIFDSSNYKDGVSYPHGPFADNQTRIQINIHKLDLTTTNSQSEAESEQSTIKAAWQNFNRQTKLEYGRILHATVLSHGGSRYFYDQEPEKKNMSILTDILERERLVKRSILEFSPRSGAEFKGSVSYVELTYLAVDLIKTCTRR